MSRHSFRRSLAKQGSQLRTKSFAVGAALPYHQTEILGPLGRGCSMEQCETSMKCIKILIFWLVITAGPKNAISQFTRDMDDTCQDFIKSVEQADETMDQTRPKEYSDIAESIYAALNNVVVQAGLAALPLSQDGESRAARSIVVAQQCRKDMRLMYHNAVANAYVRLREAVGLPSELRSNR